MAGVTGEGPRNMESSKYGVLEIWDLSRGGGEPLKQTLDIWQGALLGSLVSRISRLCKHEIGSFGLILQWERNKVDLRYLGRELKMSEIGVDFSSGSTYTVLVTEWPSSPSDDEEQTRVPHWHNEEIELPDKDRRKSTEIGADSSSPSTVMLLVTETAEPSSEKRRAQTSIPSDDCSVAKKDSDWCGEHRKDELYAQRCTPSTQDEQEKRPAEKEDTDALYKAFFNCTPEGQKQDESTADVTDSCTFFSASCKGDDETETDGESRSERLSQPMSSEHRKKRLSRSHHKIDYGRIEQQEHEEEESNRRTETAYVGLVNQAMTCYLNSLIQALYMTPEFRNALYNWEYVNGAEKDEATSIPYQLQKLFVNLQTSRKNAIETTSLTKSFGWDSTEAWQQHDIQELCRVMFDALEQKFKKTEQADLINRLYEGKMIDYVKCLECGTEKSREDTFLDIPLPVKPFGSNVAYNSVEEALAAFVQPETLDGTNQYHCETCNKKCDAHKGLKFTKFPYLLTLHLKRFDFDYNTFHRIKLNDEVTFPDVLNLNRFIPSTASQDSPCADEDGSVGAKCDDSSTTDSGTLDDECPPCDNGMSVSDHSTSHDHDDDEGIDMSNGPSTSSYSTHNHDNGKIRGSRPAPRGPYEYELFSIMIHSGSASGGHYYAYIKDFRTGEWLCFNDQNVSPITDDDIQKTYGGGPTRAYYSGVYSSSTNAYMLMYRQIDPARNTLPMQVADFPKHLKELLMKMKDNEYNDTKNRESMTKMYKLKVLCQRPGEKSSSRVFAYTIFLCQRDDTWAHLTDRAYKSLCPDNLVDRDQVRLVIYQESTALIERSFDGREEETLQSLLPSENTDLFLEIRNKDEKFKTYLPGGIATKVYIIDVAKKEIVKGPINVRGLMTQTVSDYKEQLGEEIGMKPKDIHLFLQYPSGSTKIRLITLDDAELQFQFFNNPSKIFVPIVSDTDAAKSIQDIIPEITEVFGSLVSLNIELPDTSREALRGLSIPSLEEINREKLAETLITNGPTKLPTAVEGSSSATNTTDKPEVSVTAVSTEARDGSDEHPETWNHGFWDETISPPQKPTVSPPATQPEPEEWHTPEQSNSEDSSFSFSDRTLVGEGDASEDDDYPLANVDHEYFSQAEREIWDAEDAKQLKLLESYGREPDFFRATLDEDESVKILRVLVDKRMSLGTLKKLLEPYVGVPAEYFKIFRQCGSETECSRLSAPMNFHEDGEVVCIKLGRALRSGEFKVKLHQLVLGPEAESYNFLCEWIVSKEATVGETKKEILAELAKKFDLDIPIERCRLRRKNYKTASKVFLDDQKFKDLSLYWPFEIIVQELPGKEPITDPNDVVLFVRRVMKPDVLLGPIEELVVSGQSIAEVREKLCEMSGIPDEYLEIAKGKSTGTPSMSCDLMMLMFEKVLEWNRQATTVDGRPPMGLDDGSFIYYRDCREKASEPSSEDSQYVSKAMGNPRMLGISSSSRYSPRRERALKIYVDDK